MAAEMKMPASISFAATSLLQQQPQLDPKSLVVSFVRINGDTQGPAGDAITVKSLKVVLRKGAQ